MKNVYGKDINYNTRLTRHYQDWEVEMAKPNKDYITIDYFCPRRDITYDDCLLKLGKLEEFEEELGINLVIGGMALVNGIYTKQFGYVHGDSLILEKYRIGIPSKFISLPFVGPVGYGKTWALTKEELEK